LSYSFGFELLLCAKERIKIYKLKQKPNHYQCFRGIGYIDVAPIRLLAYLSDSRHKADYMHLFDSSEVLQQIDAHSCCEHWIYKAQMFAKSRDLVLLRHRAKLQMKPTNYDDDVMQQSHANADATRQQRQIAHSALDNLHSPAVSDSSTTTTTSSTSQTQSIAQQEDNTSLVLMKRSIEHADCPPSHHHVRAHTRIAGYLIEPHWTWQLVKAPQPRGLTSSLGSRDDSCTESKHKRVLSSKLTLIVKTDYRGLMPAFVSLKIEFMRCFELRAKQQQFNLFQLLISPNQQQPIVELTAAMFLLLLPVVF
jgi:hypothetical protein